MKGKRPPRRQLRSKPAALGLWYSVSFSAKDLRTGVDSVAMSFLPDDKSRFYRKRELRLMPLFVD